MLKITEKAQEYLNSNEEVQTFNSTLVYDEERYRNGKRMSLIQCLESILGKREGELKVDKKGRIILDDGEREFILNRFFCGFDYDCSTDIVLFNRQANYELKFQFPYDDMYIETCYIDGKIVAVNLDRRKGNDELLKKVVERTKKMDWRGILRRDVNSNVRREKIHNNTIETNGKYGDGR